MSFPVELAKWVSELKTNDVKTIQRYLDGTLLIKFDGSWNTFSETDQALIEIFENN
jgi:hypothetical protein